ncbi:hypothetical protein O181_054943 [Austropuccinia psidii MF-1]|uniref:Uncharacterized protein n=1 Tax=Austropuccinia psidii MF-1 TaxID=1389203 RepID=A0A9Q3HRX6_9BASI|nr:hypothetical protein [Austropuccinia psidii MF-1]
MVFGCHASALGLSYRLTDKDKLLTWFLKPKERLSALHPDISDSMINMKILRKSRGVLEYAIKCRCVEPRSREEYMNEMGDVIITRPRISKNWTRNPMESKIVLNTSEEERRPERSVLKLHKCVSTSQTENTRRKKTKINEAQVIEEV